MASNNGRGPTRESGYKFTDTIANGDSTQAILVNQDAIIDRLNGLDHLIPALAISNYDVFATVGAPKSGDDLGNGQAAFAGGYLSADPIVASSNLTIAVSVGDDELTVSDISGFSGLVAGDLIYIAESTAVGEIVSFVSQTGNVLTVSALAGAFVVNSSVRWIRSLAGSEAIAAVVPADVVKVDLKN